MQLTIFADGKSRIKPLLIFRGTGKRIPLTEQLKYGKRVTVQFQPNAWCDEEAMERWIRTSWKPYVKEEILLVLDLHKAQKTDRIKQLLGECHTTTVFVPAGCTSIVQPLDVSFNAPFKKKVESAALQHVQENLDGYLNGRFTAGERCILMTKWVGEAWEDLAKNKEIVVRSFKKCGISVAPDGSEDTEIHLEGLEDYQVNPNRDIDDCSDNEDPFANLSGDEVEIDPFDQLSDDDELTEDESA